MEQHIEPFLGWVQYESRIRWEGPSGIGESRALSYGGYGELIEDSGWTPTGVVVTLQ